MPSLTNPATASSPNMSRPTRAINVTSPPARAAATAWLAPLPPAAVTNSPPRMVSPGCGMRSSLMIMSVFELPMTRIRGFTIGLVFTIETGFLFESLKSGIELGEDQHCQADEIEQEHRGQQAVGALGRAFEFLPDEYAPAGANHRRSLAKAVGESRAGLGAGDDAKRHA